MEGEKGKERERERASECKSARRRMAALGWEDRACQFACRRRRRDFSEGSIESCSNAPVLGVPTAHWLAGAVNAGTSLSGKKRKRERAGVAIGNGKALVWPLWQPCARLYMGARK